MARATFAAGCFWGVEAAFQRAEGVIGTVVGYTGGTTKNPTYEQVCTKTTGHAEAVQVEYDPSRTAYEDLLDVFWNIHDPTARDGQGPHVGSQYRSAIFYHDEVQKEAATASKDAKQQTGEIHGTIVTEIVPAGEFYPAEEYHQKYLEKRGQAH